MSANWFYEKQGRSYGPVPWEHLRALFQTGQLAGEDAAWPDQAEGARVRVEQAIAMGPLAAAVSNGVAETVAAREEATKTAVEESAATTSAEEAGTAVPARQACRRDPPWARRLRQGKQWLEDQALAAAANIRDTAEWTKLNARLARLRGFTLPAEYLALGRYVRKEGAFREDFVELYGKLDELAANIRELRSSGEPDEEFPSLTDRAVSAAARVGALAKAEAVARRARVLLTQLGEAAFARHGEAAGPQAITQPIAKHLAAVKEAEARAAELKSRLARLVTPRRLAIGGVAAAVAVGAIVAATAPGALFSERILR